MYEMELSVGGDPLDKVFHRLGLFGWRGKEKSAKGGRGNWVIR
jgi:hypothetical protein